MSTMLLTLHGLRFAINGEPVCCRNMAQIAVISGKPELHCADCGKHRQWLDGETIRFLMTMKKQFPDIASDVHRIRLPVPVRGK